MFQNSLLAFIVLFTSAVGIRAADFHNVRDFLISNITATGVDALSGIQITGLPNQPIENVRLQNIRIHYNGGGTREQAAITPRELGSGYPEPSLIGTMPSYGLFARHVRGLELADLTFDYDKDDFRPAIRGIDVDGLEIDHLKARHAEGVEVKSFERVTNASIWNSPDLDE